MAFKGLDNLAFHQFVFKSYYSIQCSLLFIHNGIYTVIKICQAFAFAVPPAFMASLLISFRPVSPTRI